MLLEKILCICTYIFLTLTGYYHGCFKYVMHCIAYTVRFECFCFPSSQTKLLSKVSSFCGGGGGNGASKITCLPCIWHMWRGVWKNFMLYVIQMISLRIFLFLNFSPRINWIICIPKGFKFDELLFVYDSTRCILEWNGEEEEKTEVESELLTAHRVHLVGFLFG